MSRSRAILAALLVGSCVDLGRPDSRRAAPAVRRARDGEVAAARARRARLPRLSDAARSYATRPIDVSGRDPGVTRVIYGPLRVEARGASWTLADDVPPDTGFAQAARAREGWVFLTQHGDVYGSATFTGRLRRLGSLRCSDGWEQMDALLRADGDRVVLHGNGQLASTDGATLRLEADPAVIDLAWRDAQTGARITASRGVEQTADGGLYALTTAGEFRVDEETATRAASPPPAPPRVTLGEERLRSALLERYEVAPRAEPGACPRPVANETQYQTPGFRVAPSGAGSLAARWAAIEPGPRAPLGPPDTAVTARDPAVMVYRRWSEDGGAARSIVWRSTDALGSYTSRMDGVLLPVDFATDDEFWRDFRVEQVSLARGPGVDDPVCVERVCGVELSRTSDSDGETSLRTSICFVTSTPRPSLRVDTGQRIQTAPAVLLPWRSPGDEEGP